MRIIDTVAKIKKMITIPTTIRGFVEISAGILLLSMIIMQLSDPIIAMVSFKKQSYKLKNFDFFLPKNF